MHLIVPRENPFIIRELSDYHVILPEHLLKNVSENMPTLPLREYRNHLAFVSGFSDILDQFRVTWGVSETIMAQELSDPDRLGALPHDYGWPSHLDLPVAESVEGAGGPDAWCSSASQGNCESLRGWRVRSDYDKLSSGGVESARLEGVGCRLLSSTPEAARSVDDIASRTTSSPRQAGRTDVSAGLPQGAEPLSSLIAFEIYHLHKQTKYVHNNKLIICS